MSKCIRCGDDVFGTGKICSDCLNKYTEMGTRIFDKLQEKHEKLCADNLKLFQKERKRLERIWRKDKIKFEIELDKL